MRMLFFPVFFLLQDLYTPEHELHDVMVDWSRICYRRRMATSSASIAVSLYSPWILALYASK